MQGSWITPPWIGTAVNACDGLVSKAIVLQVKAWTKDGNLNTLNHGESMTLKLTLLVHIFLSYHTIMRTKLYLFPTYENQPHGN